MQQKKRPVLTDEFIAAVAHEIRNPLSSVKMNLQVFSRSLAAMSSGKEVSIPNLQEHLRVALKSLEHLERIVNDIMDVSRPEVLEFASESMADVIEASLLLAENDLAVKGVRVVKNIGALPKVEVDARRMEQALLNIFLNGIHAMKKGGRLMINAGERDGIVSIVIEDDGKGMPPEVLSRVFEPFFTTSPEGTGLGLTLTKRLIEQEDGTISIESELGKGTRVTVMLPCRRKRRAADDDNGHEKDTDNR